jgi:N-acetylglucosamine transport system permease protein
MTNTLTAPPAPGRSPVPGHRTSAKRDVGVLNGMAHIALVFWALATVGPLLWVVLASFKSNTEIFLGNPFGLPETFTWEAYSKAWETANVGSYFLNSLKVVFFSTLGTMVLGSMAAYVLARYRFAGNRLIYYVFVAGLAFPPFMALPALMLMLYQFAGSTGYETTNNHFVLILVYIAYSLPFTVFFLAAFFKSLPNTIAEAAIVDGAGHFRLFWQVMMPLAKSGLVSITIFNIVGQWNQYLIPVALISGTGAEDNYVLTQGIANISVSAGYQAEWGTLFAALTMSILPMIIVYAFFQRQIQAGLTAGAIK